MRAKTIFITSLGTGWGIRICSPVFATILVLVGLLMGSLLFTCLILLEWRAGLCKDLRTMRVDTFYNLKFIILTYILNFILILHINLPFKSLKLDLL
jgi:hypothetical protein